jgi:hypothetical protein
MFLVSLDINDQKISLFILFSRMSYFSAARLLERDEKQLASLVEMSLFEPEFAGKLSLLVCKNWRILFVRALRNTPHNKKYTKIAHFRAHACANRCINLAHILAHAACAFCTTAS